MKALWKLAAVVPWPIALVLLVFWESAEAERIELERQLDEERTGRLLHESMAQSWREKALRERGIVANLEQRLGIAVSRLGLFDISQWAELRDHVASVVAGKPYPLVVERVVAPAGLPSLRAAAERVVASKGRFPAHGGLFADLTELEAAMEELHAALPSTEHPDSIGMDCADILTIAERLTQTQRHELLAVARQIRDGKPATTRLAALEKVVATSRAMRSAFDAGHGPRWSRSDTEWRKALDELDAIHPEGSIEDPVYVAAHSVIDQWRWVASNWDGALTALESALGRKAPLPPEHATSVAFPEGEPLPTLLFCPFCGAQHVDRGEFATRRHHKHLCAACGRAWRVEPYAVGVEAIPGRAAPEARAALYREVPPQPLDDTPEEIAEAEQWLSREGFRFNADVDMKYADAAAGGNACRFRLMAREARKEAAAYAARAAELGQAEDAAVDAEAARGRVYRGDSVSGFLDVDDREESAS